MDLHFSDENMFMYALQSLDVLELDDLTWASRPEDLSKPAQEMLQLQVGFRRLSRSWVPATYIIVHSHLQCAFCRLQVIYMHALP